MKSPLSLILLLLISSASICQNQDWEIAFTQSPTLGISCMEFSPDGNYLATGSIDGSVKVWEVNSQKVIYDLKAHATEVTSFTFTKDGQKLLSSSQDGTVKIWRMQNGKVLNTIYCYPDGVGSIDLNADNSTFLTLASFPTFNPIMYWDLETGEDLGGLPDSSANFSASFSYKGNSTVTNSSSYGIEYWPMDKTGPQYLSDPPAINKFAFFLSPDRKYLALVDQNFYPNKYFTEEVPTVDADSLEKVYSSVRDKSSLIQESIFITYMPRGDTVEAPLISDKKDKNKFYAVVDQHLPLEIIDLTNLKRRKTSIEKVFSASFSPNNKKLLTVDIYGVVKLWNIETGKEMFKFPKHKGEFDYLYEKPSSNALFSPDGKYIFISSKNGGATIWDASTLQEICNLTALLSEKIEELDRVDQVEEIENVSFSPQSTKLAISEFNDLYTLDLRTLAIESFNSEINGMNTAVLSPSENWILTSSSQLQNKLWNLEDLSSEEVRGWASSSVKDGIFSPNKDILATIAGKKLTIRNLENDVKHELEEHSNLVVHVNFDPLGEKIITSSWDGTAKIWNAQSGKRTKNLKGHSGKVLYAEFSSDAQKVVTKSDDGTARIWDAATDKALHTLKAQNNFDFIHFSPSGKYLITGEYKEITLWDASTGQILKSFQGHTDSVEDAIFHPDKKSLVSISLDKTIRRWSLASGKELSRVKAHDNYINTISLSPDKKFFATTSFDGTAKIWDYETLELVRTLEGHSGSVIDVNYVDGGRRVLTSGKDGKAIMWDVSSGEKIFELFNLQDKWYDPEEGKEPAFLWLDSKTNYYYSSPAAAKKLYFRKGLQTISFDQLDIKFNRPDKMLEALNSQDTALIKVYKRAYRKRLEKLGIDTALFNQELSIPIAEISNAAQLNYDQKSQTVDLQLHLEDSVSEFATFNILINGVPLYGSKGIDLTAGKLHYFDTTLSVPLSVGTNQIELSAINQRGIKNYRTPLRLNYQPSSAPQPKVHFVGLGIDHFKQAGFDLRYSIKDVRDLAGAFKTKYGESCIIDTLFDKSITIENLEKIKIKLLKTSADDKVIISYSGHGLLSQDLDYYLSTYNTDFESPKIGSLPYQQLESLLDGIPARRKLLLIDACHSGEVDKDEKLKIETLLAENKTLQDGRGRGAKDVSSTDTVLGNKSIFQLMQELFVNVNNDIGATVISAAAGTQFAIEKEGNGVFTASILRQMGRRDKFTVQELKKYVSRRVQYLTDGLQKPTSRIETHNYDWVLWE